jgi:transcriptional regulator with XRE-family HTH domain
MPQRIGNAPQPTASAEQLLARIAAGLSAARIRTGLSEQQVVDLLGRQGVVIEAPTLQRWESSGLLHVDSAVHLADAYGTTIDLLAGRRAFRQRPPTADLPELPPRSPW